MASQRLKNVIEYKPWGMALQAQKVKILHKNTKKFKDHKIY